jgi:hypothetical protein
MKGFKYFLALFALVFAGVTYSYANVARLVLIDYSSLKKIENNLYASPELSTKEVDFVTAMLADARYRISNYFGPPIADPIVVVLASNEETKNFGLYNYPGMFLFAPWSDYLLLNYEKAGIDVSAHELVHAEIVSRVGYLKRQFEIPTWFDEGVAMQVDYRPKYHSPVIDQKELERVTSLASADKFWTSSAEENIKNYRGAKAAVSHLFQDIDKRLYSILSRIEAGDSFVDASEINETNQAFNGTL